MNEKNKIMIILGIIATVLLVTVLAFSIKKGTFSVDDEPTLTLNCSGVVSLDKEVVCDISLYTDVELNGVKFNYDLDDDLTFVSFTSLLDCTDCMDSSDEVGYAYATGADDGLVGTVPVGTLVLEVPEEVEVGDTFDVLLTSIELSDMDFGLITLADVYDELEVTQVTVPSYYEFNQNLSVNENDKVIKVSLNTTYSDVVALIDTNGTIGIVDKDDTTVSTSSIVKTGDKINIVFPEETVTYKIAALGDLTSDGVVAINDVSKLYRYMKGKVTMTAEYVAAGDVATDGSIAINDVSKLYRYMKGKINSLG